MKKKRILVPRFVDASNTNAQNLNAKALLSRFSDHNYTWVTTYYDTPDTLVVANKDVKLQRLWRRHFWPLSMFLFYMQRADALFYPDGVPYAINALLARKKLHSKSPIIGTMESLPGTRERERLLTEYAGHEVHCFRVSPKELDEIDRKMRLCDHMIAISPFLAKMGQSLYGDKFSVIPLGIEKKIFYPSAKPHKSERVKVVSAGTCKSTKRPELFLQLARRYPEAEFLWYGNGGAERDALIMQAKQSGLDNLSYPGGLPPQKLAEAFREADIFAMPSISEGVPKVTQEAAACGLPVVLFGYYEAPSVVHGENGFWVWNNDEFMDRVGQLINDPALRARMSSNGIKKSDEWSWDTLAPKWMDTIISFL
jgi:glycosyltransferase involved in cell wall biosynthesis